MIVLLPGPVLNPTVTILKEEAMFRRLRRLLDNKIGGQIVGEMTIIIVGVVIGKLMIPGGSNSKILGLYRKANIWVSSSFLKYN